MSWNREEQLQRNWKSRCDVKQIKSHLTTIKSSWQPARCICTSVSVHWYFRKIFVCPKILSFGVFSSNMILSVGERYYLPIRCPLNLNHNSTISVIFWNSHADNCRALLTILYIIIYLYHKLYLKQGKCYVLGVFFLRFELDVGCP